MARLEAPEVEVLDDAGVIVPLLGRAQATLDLFQFVEIHIQVS